MFKEFKDCPCSGKSSSNYAAAWILLNLYKKQGVHGYALANTISEQLESAGSGGMNITGLYRHLAALEKRGMLTFEIDNAGTGPSRKKYYLTDSGISCLKNWMDTMKKQALLIDIFFEHAEDHFSENCSESSK